jgi:hypothetical protein
MAGLPAVAVKVWVFPSASGVIKSGKSARGKTLANARWAKSQTSREGRQTSIVVVLNREGKEINE